MRRRSPTLEGFQTMFRLPVLGLAEIAWRWSFGVAAAATLAFTLREFLTTLPVTAGEMLLLRTRQPALIVQALARIFRGSAPRAAAAFIVLTLGLALGWIVLASVARALAVKTLLEYFRDSGSLPPSGMPLLSLLALNFLRAATMLAAALGIVGALLAAAAGSSPEDPSPGKAMLIFWMLAMLTGLAYALLNWYLSLAAIFVVRDRASTFGAVIKAIDFCRTRVGALVAAATWFGIAHAIVFAVASSAVAVPLGFAEVLPGGMVFGGVLVVALLYFAAVDFLYAGHQATYLFLLEEPEPSVILPKTENRELPDYQLGFLR